MKYFCWMVIATCLILSTYLVLTPRPAKTNMDSKQAERLTKLEARVDLLEAWATRHGGKLK